MEALKGWTEPRLFTPPLSPLTPETSRGFEVVEFAENILGLTLRPWQEWLFIHALELDPETGYTDFRFKTVVVEVGRQNGKTLVMMVLGLWRLFLEGASEILSAAQSLNIAEETLQSAFLMAKRIPVLEKYLTHRNERGIRTAYMRRANGGNQIELSAVPAGLEDVLDVDGAMPSWYVVPTNSGGGRSYSADLALLDELREHRTFDTVDAIEPTIMERPRSQLWAFSNAGDASSVVLRKWRNLAVRAIDRGETAEERMGLFSWSATPGCSIFDREGWAQANPSLGYGTRTERDMLAMARKAVDPDADDGGDSAGFRTEYLCQWVDVLEPSKFGEGAWEACGDGDSRRAPGAQVFVGLDVATDLKAAHVCIAATRADGLTHVELVASRPGVDWVPGWFADRLGTGGWFDGRVAVQARGAPVSVLFEPLQAAGVTLVEWGGPDLTRGTLGFYDAVVQRKLRHRNQPRMNLAADGAQERRVSDAFMWDRQRSRQDVAPIVAATAAVWLLNQPVEETPVSAYDAGAGFDLFI